MPHERLRRRRREELRSNSSAVLRSNTAFLDSSMVEHAAVNRGVVGSSPTRGGKGKPVSKYAYGFFCTWRGSGNMMIYKRNIINRVAWQKY